MEIFTGEKIQQQADVYLGFQDDFNYNPIIKNQKNKHLDINSIIRNYQNPSIIFCYSHRIFNFCEKIHFFQNNFVLITHNSDENIVNNEKTNFILECPKLKKWYAQNICFNHPKLFFIPIGIANSMWKHGDLTLLENKDFIMSLEKSKNVYFLFNINTNQSKRQPCYDSLKYKLKWLDNMDPHNNFVRLSKHKFCICPEGNGVDTHRLWEALYLKCVPIVIESEFTEILQKNNIPLVVLKSWSDFDESKLDYSKYVFSSYYINDFFKIL